MDRNKTLSEKYTAFDDNLSQARFISISAELMIQMEHKVSPDPIRKRAAKKIILLQYIPVTGL